MKKFLLQLKEKLFQNRINKFFIFSFILHLFTLTLISYSPMRTKLIMPSTTMDLVDIEMKNFENQMIKIKKSEDIKKEDEDSDLIKSKASIISEESTIYLPVFEVTTLPKIIFKAEPKYPEMARKAGIEGIVVLELDINEKGQVINIKVVRSGGFGFDQSAIEAIKKTKFSPALKYGKPVPIRVRLPVKFELQ